MRNLTRLTVTLGKIQSDHIAAKIAGGDFVSAGEVIRAGIAALTERDAMVERWLEKEVISIYHASFADPSRLISSEGTFAELRAGITKKIDIPS
jgi:antitoxin ParD1/3/4